MEPTSRRQYVTDGLIGIGFGLFCLAFGWFFYWIFASAPGMGELFFTWSMRNPVAAGLTRILPWEVLQIFALLCTLVGVLGGIFFIGAGFQKWIHLVTHYRQVSAFEEEIRMGRERRAARLAREKAHEAKSAERTPPQGNAGDGKTGNRAA
ncbi:MAG: hypothetical protein FJ033_15795 [Chloroflexi bacterium]|nr:hypothetical protein [Chloroflexota bacterium]